jgi:hypothetical protein
VPRAAVALVLAALATGCAVRAGGEAARVQDVTVGAARFRVHYFPEDAGAARQVVDALVEAAPRVERWGVLSAPVTVIVHPSHAALEAAVHRSGYDWLRAWARYAQIDLQSPRTWGILGASDREVRELVAHELTHCAMYQLAGDDLTWMYKEIPRWFSEGLASVSAGQGYRRGGLVDLSRYYEDAIPGPGSGDGVPGARARVARGPAVAVGDPLLDPDSLYQEQSEIVYGAAHHAVVFLLSRYGEERVHRIVRLMGQGRRFPAAFREAIGIGDAEFASDFRRYVGWQGWRRDAR